MRNYTITYVQHGSVQVTEIRIPKTKPVTHTQKFKEPSITAKEIADGMAALDPHQFNMNMKL